MGGFASGVCERRFVFLADRGENMNLDQLLAQEKTIRTKVDYVAMFKRDPQVVKYCLDARAQHAAAVEARDRVASDMEKIRRLVHGRDMRFHGLRDLVGLLEEFDLCASA